MSILLKVYLFVLGLIWGSFINAWVWRLRQLLNDDGDPKKLSATKRKELSILHGRSMCPSCKHALAAKDLVPVFSWLLLKGKCRYCHAPISAQYPLVELITAVVFALSYIFWPISTAQYGWVLLAGWLVTLVFLLVLAIYDAKWYILPSELIYLGIITYGASLLFYAVLSGVTSTLVNAIAAGVLYLAGFFALFYVSYIVQQHKTGAKAWLGFGDVRLAFLLGLIAGSPLNVFIAVFLASLVGLAVAIPGIVSKKLSVTSHIPFGPFLILGASLALFFGSSLTSWYSATLLGL